MTAASTTTPVRHAATSCASDSPICFSQLRVTLNTILSSWRRWIENTISDTVIVDSMNMDYRRYYGKSYEWAKSHDVRNMWYRFSFEDEHSASMFALVFSEWIKLPTKWHPKYPEDEEYLSRSEEERYIK